MIKANQNSAAHQAVVSMAITASCSEMISGNINETVKGFFKVAAQQGVLDNGVLE